MKFIAAVIFLLLAFTVQAQTAQDDLLQAIAQKALSEEQGDFARRTHFLDLISRYSNMKDRENTFFWYHKAVDFAREKKSLEFEADFMGSIGWAYGVWNQSDSALLYYDNALKLIEGKGFYRSESELYRSKGTYYNRKFFYETAIEYQFKALEMNEKEMEINKDNKDIYEQMVLNKIAILNNIANIYNNQLNYDKSLEFFLDAKKVMDDHSTMTFGRFGSTIYSNIAFDYLKKNEPEQAFPYIEQAYQMAVEAKHPQAIYAALFRYSKYYAIREDYPTALRYAKEALQVAEKTGFTELINLIEIEIMEIYYYLKDYASAFAYGERLLLNEPEENWKDLKRIYSLLTRLYALAGDQKNADKYWAKENDAQEKMNSKTMQNVLQEVEVKYDVHQKELEISNQKIEIAHQKTRQQLFIGGLILAGLLLTMLVIIVMMRTHRNRILVEMNAVKDKFFSIISHDLKNPAAAQRDALQLLMNNADKWDKNILTNYYKELFSTANGLVELLKNLLNWAQMQTKREFYQPVSFDLVDALQPDVRVIKNMAERKNITFEALLPPDALITADENMMITVIRNLLANAVKFTSAGGTVTLEITPHTSHLKPQTSYRISVSDTGIGMSNVETRLIASLQTRSKPGTAGESGTGLGLIVCKEMLEKNGSKLNVESEEGKGSKFWFTV
jgi:signal transduction histidine kinase